MATGASGTARRSRSGALLCELKGQIRRKLFDSAVAPESAHIGVFTLVADMTSFQKSSADE
jgi:hypothetical protein